ncbi:MAG: hypothetical protein NC400_06365 [Clostridium sp.]|nr:hypothetical protein [Clostridium sp.]
MREYRKRDNDENGGKSRGKNDGENGGKSRGKNVGKSGGENGNKSRGKNGGESNSSENHGENSLMPFTSSEKRILLIKSILAVCILNYFFYRAFWAFLPLSGIGYLYFQMEKKALRIKKKELVREQFKELLLMVSTGQKAGFSAENAFLSSYGDIKTLYGKDSSICRILRILQSGKENNIAFSQLWKEIGRQLDITEIREFAGVYEISQARSGNMAAVMEKTADIIVRKIETEKEIAVLLSAKRLEQKIMNLMPFFIMLYISVTSPNYFSGLYHSFQGALIMSVCLFVYLLAYAMSVRIISVRSVS